MTTVPPPPKCMAGMPRTLLSALLIAGGVSAGISAATPAHATGPCLFQGDWNCYGPPQYNGPLVPTWDVPPYTWPNQHLQCAPGGYRCYPAVPGGAS